MSDQAAIIILISRRDWGGFFDALDVNKDGSLSHLEFWKWAKIGDSQELLDALNKFNEVDRKSDHKLSRAEFVCHMNLSKYITDDRWDALFDELDADRNGVLCHSEFWSKMAIRNSSDLVNALNQFDEADKNNDHEISRAEFIEHMTLTRCITKKDWGKLFDELDTDKSGDLSLTEFLANRAIQSSSSLMDALYDFCKADKNNDQMLSREEFVHFMKKM